MSTVATETGSESLFEGLNCPNCQASIAPNAVVCQACGADIELMTFAAERALLESVLASQAGARPVSPEQLAPRLGDYLVQHGYVTVDQLRAALLEQAGSSPARTRPLLGQTLVVLG